MKYLVALHHPDDYDPFEREDEAMGRDIDALNEEMVAAGVRLFVGGLRPVAEARSLTDGHVRPGPYLPGNEHVAGFWVLECADEAEALDWARKALAACRAPVEVRPFF